MAPYWGFGHRSTIRFADSVLCIIPYLGFRFAPPQAIYFHPLRGLWNLGCGDVMSKMKKKLDALRALHGLTSGADLKPQDKPPTPAPEDGANELPAPHETDTTYRTYTSNKQDKPNHTDPIDNPVYEAVDNADWPEADETYDPADDFEDDRPVAPAKPAVAKLADLLQSKGLKTGSDWQSDYKANPTPQREPRERASSMANRLGDLTDRLGVSPGHSFDSVYSGAPRITQEEREAGTYELDKVIPGEVHGDDEFGFYLIRHDYPLEHRQGIVELGNALQSKSKHIALSACDPELEDFDPRTACFVDTETTGLSGGTGTVAFLVGVGYFVEDAFRLDQCIMRDFDDEEPMLQYLAEVFDRHETLVSYNGKSFDLPLLRTRFIQNRIPFREGSLKHLDLVHAARRFWKQRLRDCSSGNVEREILAIFREGDVPSYLIPQLWFRYLEERDARPLEGVIYHHEMDILSLVALTAWMSECLDAPAGQGFAHVEDKLSVVRIHYKQKHYEEVIEHAKVFLEEVDASPLRRECLEMLGYACKRRGLWEEMQEAWEGILEEFPADPVASHELAKHHEHRTRDLEAAVRLCREALTHYATAEGSAGLERQEARAFRHRLERLEKKLKKRGGELEF